MIFYRGHQIYRTGFEKTDNQGCRKAALNFWGYSLLSVYHSSTETTRIYAVPSVDMMRKVMESGNLESDEKPLWPDDEAEMARICGLR